MDLFKNANTKELAKQRYNELSKIYHPDVGKQPDGEMFIELTNCYKEHLQQLENPKPKKPNVKKEQKKQDVETADEVVEQIIKRVPKLTDKQKKSLKKGTTLIFSVILEKYLDRV